MSKIYLPSDYLNKSCYQVNDGYIRVYDTINIDTDNTYTDIYINQDYMLKTGTAYIYNSISCDNINTYTNDIWFRTDIDKILVIFIILFIIIFYFPYKIWSRFFGKWSKL